MLTRRCGDFWVGAFSSCCLFQGFATAAWSCRSHFTSAWTSWLIFSMVITILKTFLRSLTFMEDKGNRQSGYYSAVVLWFLISGWCIHKLCYCSWLPPLPFVNGIGTVVQHLEPSWGWQSHICCHRVLLEDYHGFRRNPWQADTILSPSCCLAKRMSLTRENNFFLASGRCACPNLLMCPKARTQGRGRGRTDTHIHSDQTQMRSNVGNQNDNSLLLTVREKTKG